MKVKREAKCVVWDLDGTIWHGVLLEDKRVIPKDNITEIIQKLDSRGIVNSIALSSGFIPDTS